MLNLLLVVLMLALVLASRAWAQEAPRLEPLPALYAQQRPDFSLGLDLHAFSQADHGGNPLVDEGFTYQAVGLDFRARLSERLSSRGSGTLAYLHNAPLLTLPATVANAHVTSASLDFTTLDAALAVDWTSADGRWGVSPGAFYHHQWAYLSGGLDLDVRHTLEGGNTTLRLAYNGRLAQLRQRHWDGTPNQVDSRLTHNVIVGWTRNVSASLVASVGAQYTRQDGLLHSTLQFVGLAEASGAPVLLVNEELPRTRNRVQLNLRGRFTPQPGTSVGLDLSGYYDDWALLSLALEPSLEVPLPAEVRLRVWYRLAGQQATRYFAARPTETAPFITQNSNLGSFLMHSPGATLLVPLSADQGTRWLLRVSVLGFSRSDALLAFGGSAGVSAEW
jgi:hypothetical protein